MKRCVSQRQESIEAGDLSSARGNESERDEEVVAGTDFEDAKAGARSAVADVGVEYIGAAFQLRELPGWAAGILSDLPGNQAEASRGIVAKTFQDNRRFQSCGGGRPAPVAHRAQSPSSRV